MPVDTKELIGESAMKLLLEKKVRKLTVTDIVEECHITRQAFYYHFSDIPEMLGWLVERKGRELLQECRKTEDMEGQLRRFLLIAVNAQPVLKTGLESNYGPELEKMLRQHMEKVLYQSAGDRRTIKTSRDYERRLVIRYHSQAILGLLRGWTEEDTQKMDTVVHTIMQMITSAEAATASD